MRVGLERQRARHRFFEACDRMFPPRNHPIANSHGKGRKLASLLADACRRREAEQYESLIVQIKGDW